MAKNHEELDQYSSMSLDPPASPRYYEGCRGSEGIEERDSIMEESDSDTIGRSALEDEGENESGVVDGWSEDAKNALAVQYRRHKKEFWEKIGELLDISWREAEAMHFRLSAEELSSRAGETPPHPTVNDMITDVQKGIDHLSGLLHLVTDEPHEELTYSRLLHALARVSTSAAAVTKHIDENLGTWKAKDIASMDDEVERYELVPGVINVTMTEGSDHYVLVPETTRMTLEIRK